VTAMRSGLPVAGYGHAKHRAAGRPALDPYGQSRLPLLRRPRFWAGLVGIVIGMILVAAFLYDATPPDDREAPTSPTGSSVSVSTVAIGEDGEVHVVVNLRFADPVDRVTLHVPEVAWAGGEFEPVVDGITLDIGGERMSLEESLTAGERSSVALPSDAVEVRLEYDATGTFAASTPSRAGRGLVLLTPLTVEGRATLSQVEVLDDRVLNLGCVGTGELSACATRDGATWIATPVADAEQVIAQVDLEPR
jgi:hypothetical protein